MTLRQPLARLVVLLILSLALPACSVHRHTVGAGPQGLGQTSQRQFYWLFGLFRINRVDTQALAEDRTTYEIVTEKGFVDWLFLPLLVVTVNSRTVTVYR